MYTIDGNNPEDTTEKNLFIQIWFNPRKVFRFITAHRYDRNVVLLLFFSGIITSLSNAVENHKGDDSSLSSILFQSILLGGLLGWIAFYIYAALIGLSGPLVGGYAKTKDILRIVAYAMFPMVLSILLYIPQIAIYGIEVFTNAANTNESLIFSSPPLAMFKMMELLLGLWTMVLFVIGISEVQQISIGKAIINLLLPGFLLIGIFLLFFLII